MKSLLGALALLVLTTVSPQAQPAPFDMSPERPAGEAAPSPPTTVAPSAPATVAPSAPATVAPRGPAVVAPTPPAPAPPSAAPTPPTPTAAPAPSARPTPATPPAAPSEPTAPPAPPAAQAPAPAGTDITRPAGEAVVPPPATDAAGGETAAVPGARTPSPTPFRRHILPMENLVMSGEIAQRSWSIFLTAEQAASPTVLAVGYQSAIFVAPEPSRLEIAINGTPVIQESVNSPGGVKQLRAAVPAGLLRAGANEIRFASSLRHRTDCTIASTYEIWADIDPAQSYLEFAAADAGQLRRIEDIGAIGADALGRTRFRIFVPPGNISPVADTIIRLSEGLALLAGMPNQSMQVVRGDVPTPGDGELTVLVGPAADLAGLVTAIPPAASTQPTFGFVTLRQDPSVTVLVVTGPDWKDVDAAVQRMLAPIDRPISVLRTALAESAWRTPDSPLFLEGRKVSFEELGIRTQEFSGRRFRSVFTIGMPADFYAKAYGKATILLDAAYAGNVRSGSHFDIYVNGNIATTLPLGSARGAVLEHFPIEFTMRHLTPGINEIVIEAILLTSDDAVCRPTTTGEEARRFAIFETSELQIPNFARISSLPNLAPTRGVGFPYNRQSEPFPLLIERGGADGEAIISAAATLLGQLSFVAGRPLPFVIQTSAADAAASNALFIATAGQMPTGVLPRLSVSETVKTEWGGQEAIAETGDGSVIAARWQGEVGISRWRQKLADLQEWMTAKFDIIPEEIRLRPAGETEFVPPASATLMVAQGMSPSGDKVWTAVNAPTAAELVAGVEAMTAHDGWMQLGDSITTYDSGTRTFTQIQGGASTLVPSQPASFWNLRLVAANWLSENVLSYAGLLAIVALLLGLATTALVSQLGRRK
ncbi:cellulose biosynthesis cyclic di-GMP-binding regulatory protein BcsB [Aurantimonas sp. HBX-1]|uniref:cellulose biosynthesis cyclic di-GMP-binding regulatory protein BcsB n=1 Tax=Aurantimonas sp. HBX-1 TaxID=2906072 RepID=UPI001F1F647A|nr:cellulose biosynthesis cyclic di-GMP-binding regulatory protein BcsB [Aurantimonas sp. HBX-1]UIJ73146.1 cellulose biosynthesis cyclic di-GMP-binding regulatory protein BcsB [Aurantimonas sp. HBX-1]